MAFGGFYTGYPATYAPMQTAVPQQQSQTAGLIWVQGIEAAKAYPVAPGNTVQLWDSEAPTVYLKAADHNGMPQLRAFDLVERVSAVPRAKEADYVTRQEFEELKTLVCGKQEAENE